MPPPPIFFFYSFIQPHLASQPPSPSSTERRQRRPQPHLLSIVDVGRNARIAATVPALPVCRPRTSNESSTPLPPTVFVASHPSISAMRPPSVVVVQSPCSLSHLSRVHPCRVPVSFGEDNREDARVLRFYDKSSWSQLFFTWVDSFGRCIEQGFSYISGKGMASGRPARGKKDA
ncbi:ty3-gypsy retrotransposon protein [Cucumis melo var. makuwa]|uniref:Ty3-gypsy retrotransposon protein n=1 Tax=Cucumis melo var. makuwa TaxID=1194695 RepID=A0A5A7USU4_CUCMM|nr:ty3-gypsy retrotransposon protein [Cucumis melo var. makuwa]